MRRSPFAVAFALSATAAFAAPETPCSIEGMPGAVTELGERLARTRDRGAFATIAQDAARIAGLERDPVAKACAHYHAASAHFLLSVRGADKRRHAADAVRHFLAAAALSPDSMDGRQPVNRFRTAWQRVGRVEGWLTGGLAPAEVVIDAPGEVTLSPGDAKEWAATCGDTPTCKAAARFTLPKRARVPLRPGTYTVEVKTPCGLAREVLRIKGGALPIPKSPPCACRLLIRDGADPVSPVEVLAPGGKTVTPEQVDAGMGAVTVSAPGYVPRGVSLPKGGGEVTVTLERCPVTLIVHTDPAGARLEGAGPGPWGARAVRATLAGFGAVETTVEIPRPESCEGAHHEVTLPLGRQVQVAAMAGNKPVRPQRLVVGDEEVSVDGFSRPPGRYTWQAWHPGYVPAMGHFEVAPCQPGQGCPPVAVGIEFHAEIQEPPEEKSGGSRWALATVGLGGVAIAGGLISGGAAWSTQQDIDGYTNREAEGVPIDDLVDRRDAQASTADVLVATGAAVLVAGVVWYLVSR